MFQLRQHINLMEASAADKPSVWSNDFQRSRNWEVADGPRPPKGFLLLRKLRDRYMSETAHPTAKMM
jgi:hypothetical protein